MVVWHATQVQSDLATTSYGSDVDDKNDHSSRCALDSGMRRVLTGSSMTQPRAASQLPTVPAACVVLVLP
jgi:hypothetical protein